MAIQAFKDYVFSGNVKMIMDSGVFVGTKNYLFFIPSVLKEFKGSTQITTSISYGDRPVRDVVSDLIAACNTVEELENVLLDTSNDNPNIVVYRLDEVGTFKVEVGFLGSGIHVKKEGKKGFAPFVQSLGKEKKEIKLFYLNHPKYH